MILARIIQLALSQRLLTLLAALVLTVFGVRAMLQLPIDAFPDLSPTQVQLIIQAPGMTPEEVETQITRPVETELLGIPRQAVLRSVSQYALSSITMDFDEGTDGFWARQQVSERLANIWGELPGDIQGGLAPMSTPLGEMFMFTLESETLDLETRRHLLDWVIRPALRSVPGVADVNALGGYVRSYQVMPDPYEMAAHGVTLDALVHALQDNIENDGAGRLDQGEEFLLVRSRGSVVGLEDLAYIHVPSANGQGVRLSQVANVTFGSLSRYGSVTADGERETVQGLVVAMAGANAREVLTAVKQRLDELAPVLPESVSVEIFYDRSELVSEAVTTVAGALLLAMALVVLVLGLFLGDLRAAVTAATILPLAALATFLLMRSVSMSANLMSLGGLIIAIGMLVDSAIVVVENCVASLNRRGGVERLPRLHRIYRAAKDVAVPVAAGVLIIVIVFLPLLGLEGLEGKLFRPVTMTIIFALLASLLLSLTLIPVIASLLLRTKARPEPRLVQALGSGYASVLGYCLLRPRRVLLAALILLGLALTTLPFVGRTFMPVMDEGDLVIQVDMLPSINLEHSTRVNLMIERALMEEIPEIERIVSRLGSDELGMDPMPPGETDMFLQLKPRNQWSPGAADTLEDRLREVLDRFRGLTYGLTMPIEMRVSEMLTGARGDLAIQILGDDLTVLNELAQSLSGIVSNIPGAVDTSTSLNEGQLYLEVEVDRIAAGELGVDIAAIQRQLRSQVEGLRVATVAEGDARIPLMLRLPPVQGDAVAALEALLVTLPQGEAIALGEIARVQRTEGPVSIQRESGQRFSLVTSNVSGRDLVGFVQAAQQAADEQLNLPQGYRLAWGGEFENQQRAAARLSAMIPLSIGLIALVLFLTFQSARQAAIILVNIPFALTGGLIALWLTGAYLSVPASVGFIALLGIAVLNGVVMMSYFNLLAAKGLSAAEVALQGAQRRLRPVLMTATTTAAGLTPLLLASGPGSEIQKPLAIVVIGGLISSTLLTLFLLPVFYQLSHRRGYSP